jgi:putative ABC transport system permease protein
MQVNARETLGMATDAVWSHKLRSGLTILGIVIGITTVVTVAALLTGLNKSMVDFFKQFGPNNIFISKVSGDPSGANATPKERRRRPLRPEYVDYLRTMVHSIDAVALSLYVTPPSGRILTAKVPGYESENMSLQGETPNLYDFSPRDLREGRMFTPEENHRGMRLAVLGASIADALFPNGNAVGKTFMVDGVEYTVLGVFEPAKGGFFGENGMDHEIVIPYETARMHYPEANIYYITAHARPGQRDDAVAEIRDTLRKLRHLPKGVEDDFVVSTPDSIVQNLNKITGMIVLISIAISAVGLLVGGIGVMNIMLVSVTERTREIGVRKAIGARRRDIVAQFLAEAVALTGLGGIIGILFSVTATTLISAIFPTLPAEVPAWAVVTGFTVSVAVGVFFGVWPAVLASRLDPVEALRYE